MASTRVKVIVTGFNMPLQPGVGSGYKTSVAHFV